MTTPSQFLKSQTAAEHERTEREPAMQRLLARDLSLEEFAQIQARFFGVFSPLEFSISHADFWSASGVAPPQRSRELESDLQDLGVSLGSVVRADVSSVDQMGEKLGRIYVLEGSRLGGRMIRKVLNMHEWFDDAAHGLSLGTANLIAGSGSATRLINRWPIKNR